MTHRLARLDSVPCPSDMGCDPANEPEIDEIALISEEIEGLSEQQIAEMIYDLRDDLRSAKRRIGSVTDATIMGEVADLRGVVASLRHEMDVADKRARNRIAALTAESELSAYRACLYGPENDYDFRKDPAAAAAEALRLLGLSEPPTLYVNLDVPA